ncbi:OpgC domain-containing protein [Nocardioides sp. TRM66260-LWL]|uniref:OpgC domain-containing protein n=1 Tax=Nocardioides sp. TRM66260-LWL TaxID=2874478 RepID=UPI001CC53AD6|nr:OpgC domain-containing protein [Nocardioides sp. TRM66260-LWL]MBZ5732915.1 OpgC domain-containing protein [Nocardioides sp. TRM66260-LWL]
MSRARAVVGLALALLLLLLLTPGPANAVDDPSPDPVPPLPAAGSPWFGPALDWTKDSAQAYADRLGTTPSLYAQRVHYPLTPQDETYLRQFVEQAASQGAVPVVDLEPQIGLADLTEADAQRLADVVAQLHVDYDSYVLLRFAPEMNGSWVIWGQQPQAYRAAFRRVADAVHATTDQAAMVWSPAYGAGYPFGRSYGEVPPAGRRDPASLDTNRDGRVTDADDPYAPYWPGSSAVDWVGLSLFRFGAAQPFGQNTLPAPDEFRQRLAEQWEYGSRTPRTSFYERFATSGRRPMLVSTSALVNLDADPGPGQTAIMQTWWREVFAANADHPLIRGITWLELSRPEDEIGGDAAQWGATRPQSLADRLRADLESSGLTLGPVTRVLDQQTRAAATAQGRQPDDVSAEMGWLVLCVVLLAVAYLVAGLVGRLVPSWRYVEDGTGRDHRLDLFRGWIIITVVATHVEVAGVWSYVSLNAIGAITGAEMFVLLSGIVLGMVYRPALKRAGEWATAVVMWRRARKQYVTALVVVLLVPLLGLIPKVRSEVVSTFTDRGTGEGGGAAQGQVYDLYPNVARLLDYPPPWYAVKQLLLLEMGPWVFNIMGLFVVLSLVLPACMWLVRRRLWWLLLTISWALYVVSAVTGYHPLPSQFEFVFPLLTWQLPFTHGLVIGWHRRQVVAALTSRRGQVVVGVLVVAYAAFLGYLWICHHRGVAPMVLDPGTYAYLYQHAYTRVFLQPGRLVDLALMLVVAYAVLTTCWRPIDRLVGWFWTPMGENSLYVFIVHVFFVIAVGSLTFLDGRSFWVGTAIHTVVVLAIWAMVKRRVLFRVIPR